MNRVTWLNILFYAVAILLCVTLSFRPIPEYDDPNDTGRYVIFHHDWCNGERNYSWDTSVSYQSFKALTYPSCWWIGGDKMFLFLTSFIVPLSIACWWRLSAGGVLLGLGFLLSVSGFDLMTNILRQGTSLFFLTGAFTLNKQKKTQLIFLAIAMCLHDSSWVYMPLALIISYDHLHKWRIKSRLGLLILFVIAITYYLIADRYQSQYGNMANVLRYYSDLYEEKLANEFLIFIVLPLYWIIFVRLFTTHYKVSFREAVVAIYSSAILLFTILFFPYITYRFTMTSIALQLLMVTLSNNLSIKCSLWIFCGLLVHFIIFSIVSPNVWHVLYG